MTDASAGGRDDKTVRLEVVAERDKPVLARLIELYRHDLSEFRGYPISAHGTFGYRYLDLYFLEADREACFIRRDDDLAGFTMSRKVGDEREVAEFFVLRAHRRSGVGRAAAHQLFGRHPGPWIVAFDTANTGAGTFWRAVAETAASGSVDERSERPPARTFDQIVLRFRSEPSGL